MQFYATLISLYRPYMYTHLIRRGQCVNTIDARATLQDAALSCFAASHRIADILRCYQKQHSLRRTNIQIVHIIFTASLVFIYDICSRPFLESRSSLRDLQLCCHALGEIGQSYGNATRALEVIILVKNEWQRLAASSAASQPRPPAKRPSIDISAETLQGSGDIESERHTRRQRLSMPTIDPPDPSAFMAGILPEYPVLHEGQATQPLSAMMLETQEIVSEAWHLLDGGSIGMSDIDSAIDWLDAQAHEEAADNPGMIGHNTQIVNHGLETLNDGLE